MLKVEDYYLIRKKVIVDGLSQRQAAKALGRSRKTIKKALKHIEPPGYRRTQTPFCPVIFPVAPIIDSWLEEDKGKPRKQRHTMMRIFERLAEEYDYKGSYDAVRRYIGKMRIGSGEVYFPLVFDPGEEAQVDWGKAWWIENGVKTEIYLFCMRLCYSTASFVRAYRREDLESVLDGHVQAFRFFGGVARRECYDNAKTLVTRVGPGRERVLTKSFIALCSHYLFETRFCNVASGNEKGHVENLVKFGERKFMTPLPSGTSLEELNEHLMRECEKDLDRAVKQREGRTRRELLEEERKYFLPLPKTDFEACKHVSTISSKDSLVHFDNVMYSVPVEHAYSPVTLKAFVERIEIHSCGGCIATHRRRFKPGFCLEYTHYIPLLERKPGGIFNGRPFKGEPWGEDLQRLRTELECRYGDKGTRKFVRVLLLFSKYSEERVKQAAGKCVCSSAFSDEAVEAVLNYVPPRRTGILDLSSHPELRLEGDGRRPISIYDGLLNGKEARS